jgi:hypothetical protein
MVLTPPSVLTALIGGGFLVWLIGLTLVVKKQNRRRRTQAEGREEEKIKGELAALRQRLDELKISVEDQQRMLEWLKSEELKCLQKTAVVRFNPFGDTGGDQSFAVALLDGGNNGLILSSLYSRTGNRIYAKTVRQGKPEKHEFSREETQAINQALSREV